MRASIVLFSCSVVVGAAVLTAAPQGQAPNAPPAGQAGAPVGRGGAGGAQPAPPKNLKVLPKEWTRQQVQRLMTTFVISLGTAGTEKGGMNGCEFCHSTDPNAPPAAPGGRGPALVYDLDIKPEKEVARKMIQMVMDVNATTLKGIGDQAVPEKVSCFTCHQGSNKPMTAPTAGWGRGGFSLLPAGPPAPPAPAGGAPGGGGPGGGGGGGARGGGN